MAHHTRPTGLKHELAWRAVRCNPSPVQALEGCATFGSVHSLLVKYCHVDMSP